MNKKRQRKGTARRVQQSTLLVVGEGPHDKAFIEHMKSLYDSRNNGQKVTVKPGDGGSPESILHTAIKERHISYDRRYVLMDSDLPLSDKARALSEKHKLVVIQSEPVCLEGMLLDALGQKVPGGNQACKARLHPQLAGKPTDKGSYAVLFDKPFLDNTSKEQLCTLRELLSNA